MTVGAGLGGMAAAKQLRRKQCRASPTSVIFCPQPLLYDVATAGLRRRKRTGQVAQALQVLRLGGEANECSPAALESGRALGLG